MTTQTATTATTTTTATKRSPKRRPRVVLRWPKLSLVASVAHQAQTRRTHCTGPGGKRARKIVGLPKADWRVLATLQRDAARREANLATAQQLAIGKQFLSHSVRQRLKIQDAERAKVSLSQLMTCFQFQVRTHSRSLRVRLASASDW